MEEEIRKSSSLILNTDIKRYRNTYRRSMIDDEKERLYIEQVKTLYRQGITNFQCKIQSIDTTIEPKLRTASFLEYYYMLQERQESEILIKFKYKKS